MGGRETGCTRKGVGSVDQTIHSHRWDNGLVLVAERMDWVESAAFTITMPAGCSRDPSDRWGLANFACEMAQRGCGEMDSRQFVQRLDRLGADRSASVTTAHTSFAAAMLADHLPEALAIHADLIRRPHLPPAQLEDGRQVCFHELQSLEDDLAQRVIQALKLQTYGDPWGRPPAGRREALEQMDIRDISGYVERHYHPRDTVVSVAGKIEWDRLVDDVQAVLGDWDGQASAPIVAAPAPGGYLHVPQDTNQTQIAIAYESVPYRHPDYFTARGAVGVLSDGMSSRLFTEVRELRGLCYTVYASYHSLRDAGRVLCYAGTSTDRAQETLDVILSELLKLADGIDESELHRLKARVRSALIMQQESSTARSGSMAADWYHLGRVRSLAEINELIEQLTCERINAYLAAHPPRDFTIVTLGAQPLEVRFGIS